MRMFKWLRRNIGKVFLTLFFSFLTIPLQAQGIEDRVLYDALKKFELRGKASVSNLTLKRDRAEMTFTGDFYFAAPVGGKITGAVFIGNGTFKAAAPGIPYEEDIMRRFLNSASAESDFKTAVLRFSDDTPDFIGKGNDSNTAAPADAQKLVSDFEPRLLKEAGINISARLTLSLVNQETPGVFLAQFDKGKLGRFTFLVDAQARIPGTAFRINGGEKTLLFTYAAYTYQTDMWMATYSEADIAKQQVRYSDEFDLVDTVNYKMEIDLRNARKVAQKGNLITKMQIDFVSLADGLKAVPMRINEGLTEYNNYRRDNSMRIKSAQYEGKDILFIQEDWEVGLTFVLPKAVNKGEKFQVELLLEGDYIDRQMMFANGLYPQNNTWYPRHGYLQRSTFNLLFRHDKNETVASVGKRVREGIWPDTKSDALTEYVMDSPIAQVSFASGKLKPSFEKLQMESGEVDLEFYSYLDTLSSTAKESFILSEYGNSLKYFSKSFGPYPYSVLRGAAHPYSSGQTYPTLMVMQRTDEASRNNFKLIGREVSRQWWGNIVSWRSYRDQWLSEGFAEYSGILYTGQRNNMRAQRDILEATRFQVTLKPNTDQGVSNVRYAESGPLILGHRLDSRKSNGVYGNLVSNKGALVMRMMHYLFTDPATGSGQAFFDMMLDFGKRYQNKSASTEDFMAVAGAHFANTSVAKQFGLKDLDWFFQQWVFEAKFPSYRIEYKLESGDNGQSILTGTAFQENVGENWFMPLPVVCKFGDQVGRVNIYVNGPQTTFKVPLPMKPSSVELDPDWWIMSLKTSTKKK